MGDEIVTLSGQRLSVQVLTYARSRNVSMIMIGKPVHSRWKE
jgi:two-component system sensor histidine kinase KdpD